MAMSIKPMAAALVTGVAILQILQRMNTEFEHMLRVLQDAIRLLA